jgi:hypothetical protein
MITLCEVQLVRGSLLLRHHPSSPCHFEGSAATRNLVHTTDSELCMLSTLHNEQDFSSYLVRNEHTLGIFMRVYDATVAI